MSSVTLDRLAECIALLEQTNSSNQKTEIVQKYPDLQSLFTTILDPLKKTGLTRNGILKYEQEKFPKFHPLVHKKYPVDIEKILDHLITRQSTGDDAKEMAIIAMRRTPKYRELLLRIFEKNLKTRMGSALFQKGTGNTNNTDSTDMSPYSPALAHDFQKYADFFQEDQKTHTWFISRKLDGVRCQVWTSPPTRALSRSGRPFKSLESLEKLIKNNVAPGYVLDGEICVLDPVSGKECFADAVSQVKRHQQMQNFCFCVMDVLTETEFQLKSCPIIYSQRLRRASQILENVLKSHPKQITVLQQIPYSEHTFSEWQSKAEDQKWEGLMLRRDSPYQGKRTKELLKVKKFHTEEYPIEDVKVGPFRIIDSKTGLEKTIETVTAVKIMHKGQPVHVGSGFTLEERNKLYRYRDKIKGQVIGVQYFEESTDKLGNISLRFPTFKCWYGNKRDV